MNPAVDCSERCEMLQSGKHAADGTTLMSKIFNC